MTKLIRLGHRVAANTFPAISCTVKLALSSDRKAKVLWLRIAGS